MITGTAQASVSPFRTASDVLSFLLGLRGPPFFHAMATLGA
jgi:hypothetical protein